MAFYRAVELRAALLLLCVLVALALLCAWSTLPLLPLPDNSFSFLSHWLSISGVTPEATCDAEDRGVPYCYYNIHRIHTGQSTAVLEASPASTVASTIIATVPAWKRDTSPLHNSGRPFHAVPPTGRGVRVLVLDTGLDAELEEAFTAAAAAATKKTHAGGGRGGGDGNGRTGAPSTTTAAAVAASVSGGGVSCVSAVFEGPADHHPHFPAKDRRDTAAGEKIGDDRDAGLAPAVACGAPGHRHGTDTVQLLSGRIGSRFTRTASGGGGAKRCMAYPGVAPGSDVRVIRVFDARRQMPMSGAAARLLLQIVERHATAHAPHIMLLPFAYVPPAAVVDALAAGEASRHITTTTTSNTSFVSNSAVRVAREHVWFLVSLGRLLRRVAAAHHALVVGASPNASPLYSSDAEEEEVVVERAWAARGGGGAAATMDERQALVRRRLRWRALLRSLCVAEMHGALTVGSVASAAPPPRVSSLVRPSCVMPFGTAARALTAVAAALTSARAAEDGGAAAGGGDAWASAPCVPKPDLLALGEDVVLPGAPVGASHAPHATRRRRSGNSHAATTVAGVAALAYDVCLQGHAAYTRQQQHQNDNKTKRRRESFQWSRLQTGVGYQHDALNVTNVTAETAAAAAAAAAWCTPVVRAALLESARAVPWPASNLPPHLHAEQPAAPSFSISSPYGGESLDSSLFDGALWAPRELRAEEAVRHVQRAVERLLAQQ